MSSKGRYIGISNRIPFVVFEYAVQDFIKTGKVNPPDYLNYIKEFTKGENRAQKTLGEVTQIVNKNSKILDQLSKKVKGDFNSLTKNDRNAVLLCLHSLTYPITYDILVAFAVGFKVQELISKKVILEKIGGAYGSNRSMHIGVDETMPLLIDTGLIQREKIGIYKKQEKKSITNEFISELLIYTDIKLSGSKSVLLDELSFKPWVSFFDLSNVPQMDFKSLLSKKESAVGKGYLTI